MNPYVSIATAIFTVVCVGLALGAIWFAANYKELAARRAERREVRNRRAAEASAKWQDSVSTSQGLTRVSVRKVGRYGKRPEDTMVLEEHMLGSIRESDANADDKISELWQRAQLRAVQLNSGPLG